MKYLILATILFSSTSPAFAFEAKVLCTNGLANGWSTGVEEINAKVSAFVASAKSKNPHVSAPSVVISDGTGICVTVTSD